MSCAFLIASCHAVKRALAVAVVLATPAVAHAQDAPMLETEDATLGSASVGEGRFHPVATLDVRNGDFSRGEYDDDGADLGRAPVHVEIGFAYALHRRAGGEADLHLAAASSNGFHAPRSDERSAPRSWYESNTIVGLIATPTQGLRAGVAYTIKASPNGVSSTTHELSATAAYERDRGVGALRPIAVATVRPKGGRGLFTGIGVEPEVATTTREDGPTLSAPAKFGVGWDGFYEVGSGDVVYGSVGLAYSHPFEVGATRWRWRAELLAVVRDDRLRQLGDGDAERSTVVPLATVSLTVGY